MLHTTPSEGYIAGVYLKTCRTSKTELFAKIVTNIQQLTIFTKFCILDTWQSSECDSLLYLVSFSRAFYTPVSSVAIRGN